MLLLTTAKEKGQNVDKQSGEILDTYKYVQAEGLTSHCNFAQSKAGSYQTKIYYHWIIFTEAV